jgi:8-oxo-dGTP diphosphatase
MTEAQSRLYPSRPILAASVAVFRDGKVLLAERTKPPAAFLFSLPGGLVEPGERLEAAAARELMEETGVTARIVGFNDHVEVIERDSDGRTILHFVVASFVARWIEGEGVTGPEASRVLWIDPADAAALPTTPGLLPILERAVRIFGTA